jgi:hypothetical protein
MACSRPLVKGGLFLAVGVVALPKSRARRLVMLPAAILAIALAFIAVPWALYPEIANGSLHDVLASNALLEALGPVLIGTLMAFKMLRLEHRLPGIPAGDVLAVGIVAACATRNLSAAMERLDGYLRPMASGGRVIFGADDYSGWSNAYWSLTQYVPAHECTSVFKPDQAFRLSFCLVAPIAMPVESFSATNNWTMVQ